MRCVFKLCFQYYHYFYDAICNKVAQSSEILALYKLLLTYLLIHWWCWEVTVSCICCMFRLMNDLLSEKTQHLLTIRRTSSDWRSRSLARLRKW